MNPAQPAVPPTGPRGQILYDASAALVLASQASAALANAELQVDSDTMLAIAAQELKAVKALQLHVEDKRTAITGPLNQAVKLINDLFRAPKDYLQQAELKLKDAILRYTTAQEAKAAEERRRALAQTHAEREALAARQHEQEHIAQEADAAALQALGESQQAARQGDLETAARAEARASSQREAAHAAREQAQCAAATVEVLSVPAVMGRPARAEGVTGRVTYTAQVTSLAALVQAVARGEAPLQCVCADDKFLAAQARAFKRAGPLFAGVEVKPKRALAIRTR